MFKTVATLLRAQTARTGEEIADSTALIILDQQIRDAAAAFESARRALAFASVRMQTDVKRIGEFDGTIRELEDRALAALADGRRDLAAQAASTIAGLESERHALQNMHDNQAAQIADLNRKLEAARQRISALGHGRRRAEAMEAIRRLDNGRTGGMAAIAEAEGTLERIEARCREAGAVAEAYEALSPGTSPERTLTALADAGYGAGPTSDAGIVLARLEAQLLLAGPTEEEPVNETARRGPTS